VGVGIGGVGNGVQGLQSHIAQQGAHITTARADEIAIPINKTEYIKIMAIFKVFLIFSSIFLFYQKTAFLAIFLLSEN
jgi:hypothetical protein